MTSGNDLGPTPPTQGTGATLARARAQSGDTLRSRDRLRIRELDRRVLGGQSDLDAWAAIVTDPALGMGDFRGAASAPVTYVARTLDAFYRRVAPCELAEIRPRIARRVAKAADAAWTTVEDVTSGKADPTNAMSRLAGAKTTLAAAGILVPVKPVDAPQSVTTNLQANFNGPVNIIAALGQRMRERAAGAS